MTKQTKNKKVERNARVKTDAKKINLSRNLLFQVPYKKVDHTRIRDIPANNCVLLTFTVLGLRDPVVSERDSKIMVKKECGGITSKEMAKYLSIAFKTKISHKYVDYTDTDIKNDKKNGKGKKGKLQRIYRSIKNENASIICVSYKKLEGLTCSGGHCFIIYKKNGEIRFFDPPSEIDTDDINKIMKYYEISKVYDVSVFYNKGMNNAFLTNNTIPFDFSCVYTTKISKKIIKEFLPYLDDEDEDE
jgi:hypothetical protein